MKIALAFVATACNTLGGDYVALALGLLRNCRKLVTTPLSLLRALYPPLARFRLARSPLAALAPAASEREAVTEYGTLHEAHSVDASRTADRAARLNLCVPRWNHRSRCR